MSSISAVIPTYNSSRTILRCLESLNAQTIPCHEILVVDRFSADGTAEIARRNGATVVQSGGNRSVARNIGAEYVSSAVIFIDSDMILPPTLLEECEDGLRKYQALLIPEVSVGFGFLAKCKSLERRAYLGDDLIEAARCFRRDALRSLRGYDPLLGAGEDWDLHNRAKILGFSVGRVHSKIMHDEGNLVLTTILRKKYTYGRMMSDYLTKESHPGLVQVNPLTRLYLLGRKVLPMEPIRGSALLCLKTLEFMAAGTGFLERKASLSLTDVSKRILHHSPS